MNAILKSLLIICIGMCMLYGGGIKAEGLKAGTAKVDLTAPVGYPMGGYGARKGVSTGIHDPNFARVVILKSGDISLALVSIDLVFFFSDRMVAEAKKKWDVDHVILSSTHTHSGGFPKVKNFMDINGYFEDPWYQSVEEKILSAIGDAGKNMFPARIAAGRGSVYLGHNRRQVDENGKVTMLWRNTERIPTGPVDPTVGVIRIDDESGEPRVVLVNYACHAVIMGPDNLQFSSDYPGYMTQYIRNEFGEKCMSVFLQGASGDINPYHDKEPMTEMGFRAAEEAGVSLGKEAVKVAKRLKSKSNANSSIKVIEDHLTFPTRYDPDKTAEIGIITAMINNDIALVGIPGEPFVQHQIDLYKRSHLDNTFTLGAVNIGMGAPMAGYLPTIQAAVEGGYGASFATMLEVGAGERIIDRAVINIYKMLNMLRDVPGDVQ